MKWGDRAPGTARPLDAAPARHASASRSTPRRGCGITSTSAGGRCPIVDTWWQTETGGDHDHAAARRRSPPSRAPRRMPFPGVARRARGRRRATRSQVGRRVPRHHAALARHAARRSGATTSAIARPTGPSGPGTLLRRRRRQARRRRLLLDPRPRGRRAERRRPPHRHDGSRERAGGPSGGGRGRGGRDEPHELKGQAIAAFVTLKDGTQPSDELEERAQGARGDEDRRDRPARRHPLLAPTCRRRAAGRSCGACSDIAEGRALGDTTTLADPAVVSRLKDQYESQEP